MIGILDMWTEPESQANTNYQPVYPYNHITYTESGHSFEMDDTPTRERIRLAHRGANTDNGLGPGSFIEMQSTGDVIHKVYGDNYSLVAGNNFVKISGFCNITIEGDAYVHVLGDKVEKIEGNYELEVQGDYSVVSHGDTSMTAIGDMDLSVSPISAGQMTITTGDSLVLSSDLSVEGEITADKIYSNGRIDAGTGISAGILGFVSLTGGLSIGIPAALPETILCAGDITALGTVNAPLGDFGISSSILGFDIVNLILHNTHIHPSPIGPTGTPIPDEHSA